LPAGEVTEIKTRMLREQLGEHLVALSGADFSAPLVEREDMTLPPRSGGEGRLASRSDASRGGGSQDSRRPPPKADASHRRSLHQERRPKAADAPPRHALRARGEGKPQRRTHKRKQDR
jgi:23S rRNA pseudouridine2605 synthase